MTDDKKTSGTPLTVTALCDALTATIMDSRRRGVVPLDFTLAFLREELHRLEKLSTETPSPRPEPKFKEGDWVQAKNSGRVGMIQRVTSRLYVRWEDVPVAWAFQDDVVPIPPKPETVQPGYRLTGVVKVPDRSEPYVGYCGGQLIATSVVYLRKDICGGLRWMVELVDPTWVPMRRDGATYYLVEDAKCPHCHKELPA